MRLRPRVLLVEDDPHDAHLLLQAVDERVDVEHVGGLGEALAVLGRAPPGHPSVDVVLLDLGLPDSSGVEAVTKLRAAHPDTPVVVLTGNDDDEVATAAVEAGAQEYLVKGSVHGGVVLRTLRHAIERERLQAALGERAKEVTSLYALTRELHLEQPVDVLVDHLASHLRRAMRWPEPCRAEVTIDGHTGVDGPDCPAGASLAAEVVVDGAVRAHLHVCYADDRPFLLPHEQRLLDVGADVLRTWIGRHDAVAAVAQREERLRLLVAQLPGLLWTTDTELRVTSVGGAVLQELESDPDAHVGVPLAHLLDDEATGGFDDTAFQTALAGTPSVIEQVWRGRSWRLHIAPTHGPDGTVNGVTCLAMDLTRERAAASELAATRARLQGIFDHASDAMTLLDDAGTYVDANDAACRLTGRTRDDLLGRHPWDLAATPVEPTTTRDLWSEFLSTGTVEGEFAVARPDGGVVETEFRAVAHIVPGVHLSVLRDVTARKRSDAALAASEQRFRLVAEAAQDAIYRVRTHPELVVEYLNPAVAAITGFPVAAFDADPRLFMTRLHPSTADTMVWRGLAPDDAPTVTVRFQHAEGHWIWLEDSRRPIVEDGSVVGVQGVVRDVTARETTRLALQEALEAERQATERLRAADQLKSHFLQAVSHELRTPLTAVLGLTKTLVGHSVRLSPAEQDYLLQRVLANAIRLDGLLADLLDLERLDHGGVRLDRQPTDLGALATRIAAEVDLGERTLVLDHDPVTAVVDAGKVERIMHNLLANAAKHTPPGTTVTVRARREGSMSILEVADDGPGVAEDLAEDVFEPFRQGTQSYVAASPGTGIGLSIARRFARLHGGDVRLQTTPGGGATFSVHLPEAPGRGVTGTEPEVRTAATLLRVPRLDADVVVRLDIDDLEGVNLARGRAAGDELLAAFERCLRQHVREGDEVARLAADDFLVLLRGSDVRGARDFVERLRRNWCLERPHPVTFSAGIAADRGDAALALALSEAALSEAQHAGGDVWHSRGARARS